MGLPPANAAPKAPALRITGLARRYAAREVLRDIDLEVRSGEAFGLVGLNGAGKSTLIKCIVDLGRAAVGQIEIFGIPSTRAEARRRVGYVPERFSPPHYLRSGEFLRFGLSLAGAAWDNDAVLDMLSRLGLESDVLSRPVRKLSKGMTQKLGLAASFLARRELYVLDEPMSGLDPASRVAVKSTLRALHGEGRTIFFTSHVLTDVEELCTSIGVLDRGRIAFSGGVRTLCEQQGEPVLERAFLRSIGHAATRESGPYATVADDAQRAPPT